MAALDGKVALVTGASRGIGREIALRLARDGAKVMVNYASSRGAAEEVQAQIVAAGGTADLVQADITDLAQIPTMFDAAAERYGRLDILINNAGVGTGGPFASVTEAAYDAVFAVTKGVFFTLQQAAARLEAGGRIVSMSTGLTRNWAVNRAAYAGSKAAIEQFSRSLSKELGARGITVNVVLPGMTGTDMIVRAPAEILERAARDTSFGRLGTPQDIADVVALLVRDEARWITGQLIVANGGSTP